MAVSHSSLTVSSFTFQIKYLASCSSLPGLHKFCQCQPSIVWKWRVPSSLVLFQTGHQTLSSILISRLAFSSLTFTLLFLSSSLSHLSYHFHWHSYFPTQSVVRRILCVCMIYGNIRARPPQWVLGTSPQQQDAIIKRGTFGRRCPCCFGNSSNPSGCTLLPLADVPAAGENALQSRR